MDGYTYLTAAYILVGEPSPLREITLETAKDKSGSKRMQTLNVPNVPTKRNYHTNIFGSLLTTKSDWQITINPIFSGSTDINLWAGDSEDPVKISDTEYAVNSPAQLAGLAKLVNAGNTFSGVTIKLNTDIDLDNRNWTPIGTDTKPFNGVFDGQNHTISSLKVTLGKTSSPAGLFGAIKSGSKVMNLTIDGAEINSLAASPAKYSTGVAVGWSYTGQPVENVTVKNAKIDAYRWAGGIIGKGYVSVNNCIAENIEINMHFEDLGTEWDNCDKAGAIIGQQDEGSYTLNNNSASNVTISGYRHIGGLFGYVNEGYSSRPKVVSGNSVNGAVLSQNFAHNYKNLSAGQLIGEICGFYGDHYVEQSNNTANDVKIILPSAVSSTEELQNAIQQGGFVNLDGDINLKDTQLNFDKPTTINLNGHDLTVPNNGLTATSELTIDGEGTITSPGFAITGTTGSTITISGGTVETSGGDYYSAINTQGSLVITGGTLKAASNYAVTLNWALIPAPGREATINGGEFIAGNNYALNIYAGSSQYTGKAVINGGTFIGTSGARADGNVNVTINGGIFIQNSNHSTGHAFCSGAERSGSDLCFVTINGGYFFGGNGYSICNANQATTIVNGGYLNKTGGGFTLGSGKAIETLTTPVTLTVENNSYSFGYQVK